MNSGWAKPNGISRTNTIYTWLFFGDVMIGKVVSILTFPGVILHEYAHKLACEYYGVPVYDVKYFSFKLDKDGWVVHAPPRDFNSAFLFR